MRTVVAFRSGHLKDSVVPIGCAMSIIYCSPPHRSLSVEWQRLEGAARPESCIQLLTMLSTILAAFILVAITVALHIVGLVTLLVALVRKRAHAPTRFWPMTLLLIQVTWGLVLIHATEIAVWALFFLWAGCLPDAESAFYFSGVTYATVGYGDVVLPQPWRMLGPIEGLTGILMCGLSAALFFAIIARLIGPRFKAEIH